MKKPLLAGIVMVISMLALAPTVWACKSPLILDLAGDGIQTTGLSWPVYFDIDADGVRESSGWTLPDEDDAFLWLDLNRNGRVDDGGELFGDATVLPDGSPASNGFVALAVYDGIQFGGDGDGRISPSDLVWTQLGLWVDKNHDGSSQRKELLRLESFRLESISLEYIEALAYDDALNLHRFLGSFTRLVQPVLDIRPPGDRVPLFRSQQVHDVIFQTRELEELSDP